MGSNVKIMHGGSEVWIQVFSQGKGPGHQKGKFDPKWRFFFFFVFGAIHTGCTHPNSCVNLLVLLACGVNTPIHNNMFRLLALHCLSRSASSVNFLGQFLRPNTVLFFCTYLLEAHLSHSCVIPQGGGFVQGFFSFHRFYLSGIQAPRYKIHNAGLPWKLVRVEGSIKPTVPHGTASRFLALVLSLLHALSPVKPSRLGGQAHYWTIFACWKSISCTSWNQEPPASSEK